MSTPDATPSALWVPCMSAGLSDRADDSGHALAGYEVARLPGAVDPTEALRARIRFWELAWTLLSDAALEFRWIGGEGTVRTFVLVRYTGLDKETSLEECSRLAAAIGTLAKRFVPGLQLRTLTAEEFTEGSVLRFAVDGERGDLMRREVGFDLADGAVDVPIQLLPGISSLRTLLHEMVDAPVPVCVSLAAAPTHIDELEADILEGELARVERLLLRARRDTVIHGSCAMEALDNDTAMVRLETTAVALAGRIQHFDRLGMLRISIAAAGEMPLTFRAAAQSGLGWSEGSLSYVPAVEPAERAAFEANLSGVDFGPWGLMVEDDPDRRTVSDCYLASLAEIIAGVWLPPLDSMLAGDVRVVEPVPLEVPAVVPREGALIGQNFASATARPAALSEEDRSRHMYVIGQTGTGKSTFAARMALHDIHAGRGVCVIDPHGDLVDDILARYPEDRAGDLILFDPRDEQYPLGLNLFETRNQAERDFAIQQVISMLYRLYDPHRDGIIGPRFEHMLRSAALTVMSDPAGGTFLDIPLLFTNERVRQAKVKRITDPVVRSFWLDEQAGLADFHKSEVLGWFVAKWGAFLSNTTMRRILGQRRSAFDMRDLMDSQKVLLVKLAKGQIGEINARILGMILVSKLQMAALGRADVPREQRTRFHLYVDEFQSLALSTFDELVAEARKYGLALTLMNQHVRQLPDAQRMALFGNVGTFCVFRLGLPDATLVAEEFDGLSVRDLTRLENYRCAVRMSVDGRVQTPFDVYTFGLDEPAADAAERTRRLVELSRATWGTPAEKAEAEALAIFNDAEGNLRHPV